MPQCCYLKYDPGELPLDVLRHHDGVWVGLPHGTAGAPLLHHVAELLHLLVADTHHPLPVAVGTAVPPQVAPDDKNSLMKSALKTRVLKIHRFSHFFKESCNSMSGQLQISKVIEIWSFTCSICTDKYISFIT